MVDDRKYIQIGESDYGNIYLKRLGQTIYLKRFTPLDYADMDEYIRDNHDTLGEWQQEAYNGDTELGYSEWLEDYEYPYDDYYDRDDSTQTYYDGNCDDTIIYNWDTANYDKEELIERIMTDFVDDFDTGDFVYTPLLSDDRLREIIGEYFDECAAYKAEREEARKPHWSCFNYYK